jgi:hypothetical protein
VRGGFALRGGNTVTRKALVRPIFKHAPHFEQRSNIRYKLRTALFSLAYERQAPTARMSRAAPSRDEKLTQKVSSAQK